MNNMLFIHYVNGLTMDWTLDNLSLGPQGLISWYDVYGHLTALSNGKLTRITRSSPVTVWYRTLLERNVFRTYAELEQTRTLQQEGTLAIGYAVYMYITLTILQYNKLKGIFSRVDSTLFTSKSCSGFIMVFYI